MQEKGVEGKNKIKERYNELAQQVTIDADGFVKALLKKKELKRNDNEEKKEDELPDTIDVGLAAKNTSPQLEEGDTLESTPTPSQKAFESRGEEAESDNMLD